MKRMIIPNLGEINKSLELAERYSCAFEYNDFVMASVLDDEQEVDRLCEQIVRLPFRSDSTLHGVYHDVIVFSADSKIRQIGGLRVRQSMNIAKRLGLKGVVFHTNHIPTLQTQEYCDIWVRENQEFWSGILKEYPKLEVYMENMFDLTPDLLARLAQAMKRKKRFGVCLDVAHAHLSDVGIWEWINALKPYIRHIHLGDNDKQTDEHLTLGEGTIDFRDLFQILDEMKIDVPTLIVTQGAQRQAASLAFLEGFKQAEE